VAWLFYPLQKTNIKAKLHHNIIGLIIKLFVTFMPQTTVNTPIGPTIWVLTPPLLGTAKPCLALAHALSANVSQKVVQFKWPFKWLGRGLTRYGLQFKPSQLRDNGAELVAPWPDLVIASGKAAIAPALWIKAQSQNACKVVFIQSPPPTLAPQFDLILSPQHDGFDAPNVRHICGTLASLNQAELVIAHQTWQPLFGALPTPRVGVLIGGTNRHFKFDDTAQLAIVQQLIDLAHQKFGLMITCSRRTPTAFQTLLTQALEPYKNVYMWHGHGENPYMGILSWADYLLLTPDSVSMTMEALQTGKPVYHIDLPPQKRFFSRGRLQIFNQQLQNQGLTRVFNGQLSAYNYPIPNDVAASAAHIKTHLLTTQR
jgi:uncharacterized protein